VSNNVALVNGSEPEPLDCQAEYVNGTDQKIKTGIGVSKKSYRNQPEQPRILGEIQDKGSISSFWALIGSVFLLVHSSIYQGLKLLGVNGEVCIEKNNDVYADDVDTWGSNTGAGNEATAAVMTQL